MIAVQEHTYNIENGEEQRADNTFNALYSSFLLIHVIYSQLHQVCKGGILL